MNRLRFAIGILAAAACATAHASAPARADVQRAFVEMCPGVQLLSARCHDFSPDEPTEAECRYSVQRNGKVFKGTTFLVVDATGWHISDEPSQCPGHK